MIILRQKQFSRRDYEGLDERAKEVLKLTRSKQAKQLNESRNKSNELVNKQMKDLKVASDYRAKNDLTNHLMKGGRYDEYYKTLEDAHGKDAAKMVKKLESGSSVDSIRQRIHLDRKDRSLLRNIHEENKWLKGELLKDTKDRRKRAAEPSIAKHEAKANELRAKKEAGIRLKKNLKKAGKGALIAGGVVAAGIGAKKLTNKKKEKSEKKD